MTRLLVLGMGELGDQPGGLNRFVASLTAALSVRGTEVSTVVVPPGRRSAPLPLRLARFARDARRHAASSDLIDAHFALYAWWPVTRGSLRGHPLVAHVHGPWAAEGSDDAPWVRAVKRRLERDVYTRASAVVVLSESVREVVVRDYGVDPARVVVLPPGVDRERFSPGPDERDELGVPGDGPLLLTVRRLVPRMGVDVLLDALRHIPNGHLAVVGDGPERTALQRQAASLGVADRVTFAGQVPDDDLPRWYRSADVSVVPSVAHEGWGLVVDESLACGTPVVAARLGGLPSALAGAGGDDCLVPPGNSRALGERLQGVLDGTAPAPSAQVCRAAAARDWATVAADTAAVYARAARPRLVVVGHCARPSGAELALTVLAPVLAERVDLSVVLGEEGPVADRLRSLGIPVDVLPLPPAASARDRSAALRPGPLEAAALVACTARLAALLRRRRATVVHAWTLKAGVYTGPAGRLAGVPVVWSARDRLADDYLPARTASAVRALADRCCAAVVANSAATLATWEPRRPASAVVGSPGSVHDPVDRRTGTPFTVGMLSRLAPWKGQDHVVRAFAAAFPEGPERLRIAGAAWFGEDDWAPALRRLAEQLGVADRVELVGHVDDVAAELAEVDAVVVYPTSPEPFGQVVVEAMTAGRPVVAADEGGPFETVTDGLDGLLVPPRSPAALSRALRRLRDEPELRDRLVAGGRRTAARYRPERLVAELVAVYAEAADRSAR